MFFRDLSYEKTHLETIYIYISIYIDSFQGVLQLQGGPLLPVTSRVSTISRGYFTPGKPMYFATVSFRSSTTPFVTICQGPPHVPRFEWVIMLLFSIRFTTLGP